MKIHEHQNTKGRLIIYYTLALLFFIHSNQGLAQRYGYSRYSFDSGGGNCTGTQFNAASSIGQVDAAEVRGETFTMEMGFLAEEYPREIHPVTLSVNTTGNDIIISWQPMDQGWVLQSTESLSNPAWANWEMDGDQTVILPISQKTQFFRMRKPQR